jgi:hypothetical protein
MVMACMTKLRHRKTRGASSRERVRRSATGQTQVWMGTRAGLCARSRLSFFGTLIKPEKGRPVLWLLNFADQFQALLVLQFAIANGRYVETLYETLQKKKKKRYMKTSKVSVSCYESTKNKIQHSDYSLVNPTKKEIFISLLNTLSAFVNMHIIRNRTENTR